MKHALLSLLIFLSVSSFGQRFKWAQGASYNGGGGGNSMVYYRSATDKHGNVYVTGYFSGTANFSGSAVNNNVTSAGAQDIFLAKYDTTGTLLWVTSAGSPGYDIGYGCAVDSADNCYLVGTFSGTCVFNNSKVMYSLGNTDGFIAKYNKNGACQWVNRFGSNTAEYAYGVDCTPGGTVYVTGYFTGFCAFLSQSNPLSNLYLQSFSNYDIFLAKYNKNGVAEWVTRAGGGGTDYGYDVSVDDSANAYIVGWFQGSATFYEKGQNSSTGIGLSASGTWYNGYVTKYNAWGYPQWAINCPTGSQYGYAYAIGGDGFGNLFVTGYYYGQAQFGSITLSAPGMNGYGSFVAKLNTNGVFEWARNIQSSGNAWAYGYDVAGNASGACFVTGIVYNWNFQNTVMPWVCNTPFPFYNNNNGWSGYHCYGVKYKSDGTCAWSLRGTSQYNSTWSYAYGYGISVNDFGSIYISGYNTNNLRFYLNADTVTSYGNVNGTGWGTFIAHFQDDNFILIDKTRYTMCPGDSFYLPFRAYGVYADSNIYRAMISDKDGGWQAFQYVGQKVTTAANDSILVRIPKNLPNGTGYRFRVEASAPLTRSNKSLNDVIIVRPVANINNSSLTLCVGDSVQLSCDSAFKYYWFSNFTIRDSIVSSPYIKPPATTDVYLRTLNQNGCENFDTLHVTVIARPIPDAGRDTSVCIGDSLQLQATGGLAYRWYPGTGLSDSTIANPKVLLNADRTYHVIVGNGYCLEEDSIHLTLRTPLRITAYNDTTICKGQSAVLHVMPTGGYAPGYNLTWDNGLGSGNYLTVVPPVTTTYKVILRDGCTVLRDSAYITVTVRPKLTVTPRADTTICKGQSVALYASASGGYPPNYTFTWNNGVGPGQQVWITPLVTTTYTVILRDNCTSQNDTAAVTIFVRGDLSVNASNDTTICIGQSATLRIVNTSGGDLNNYNYQWFSNTNLLLGTQPTHTASPAVTSDYYVVVTDNCTSKSDTDYVTIFVRQPLSVQAMPDTTICKGTSTWLKATAYDGGNAPTYTFSWYDAAYNLVGTGAQIMSPLINAPSKFYLVLSDNCTSLKDTDEVQIFHLPALNVVARIDSIICIGQPAKLYATASGGDSLHYTYRWLDSATNAFIGLGNYYPVIPTQTTTYKVVLSDNCTPRNDTDFVKILHRPPLIIKFPNDTTICKGNSVDLFVDGSGGDSTSYEFKWDNGLGSGKSPRVTPLSTASYKVILTDFCTLKSDSAVIRVTVRDPLKISAGQDKSICYGQVTTIDPPITEGGQPLTYSYKWVELTTNTVVGTTRALTIAPTATTVYRVIFSDNCTLVNDSDEIRVNVYPSLKIKIITPGVRICRGEKVTLQAQGSGGYDATQFRYDWSQNLGNKSNITFYPDSTRYYVITLSDGCSIPVSDSVLINVEQLPQPDFTVSDSIGCNPFTVQFTDASTNNANCKYLWYFGDGSQDTTMSPSHTYTKTGKFSVELRLTSPTGCTNNIKRTDFIVNNNTPVAKFTAAPVKVKISNGKVYFTSKSLYTDSLQMQFGDGQLMDWSVGTTWMHKYTDTGMFIVRLTVKNNANCSATAFDTVYVEEDYLYFMPNVFSPNNDGKNELIKPSITFADHYVFKIYDRWGAMVYDSGEKCNAKDPCGWDGMFRGYPALEDVYVYTIYILDKADKEHFERGTFLLVR